MRRTSSVTTDATINQSYSATYSTKFHTTEETGPCSPIIQQTFTTHNNNVGNTNVTNNGSNCVTKIDTEPQKSGGVSKDNSNETSLEISSDKTLTKRWEFQKPCKNRVPLLLSAIALPLGVLFLWYGGIISLNFGQETNSTQSSAFLLPDLNLTTIEDSTTFHPSTPLPTTRTTALSVNPIQFLHVDINYLLDLHSISNRTREIVIKSTKTDGLLPGQLDELFAELEPPSTNQMDVSVVFRTGSDYTYLRHVLVWLGGSIGRLSIDANISQGTCKSNSVLSSSFLQTEVLKFPSLKWIGIHNLNLCFISNWLRHFHVPIVGHVTVFSCDDHTRDLEVHTIVGQILNKSHTNYTGQYNC